MTARRLIVSASPQPRTRRVMLAAQVSSGGCSYCPPAGVHLRLGGWWTGWHGTRYALPTHASDQRQGRDEVGIYSDRDMSALSPVDSAAPGRPRRPEDPTAVAANGVPDCLPACAGAVSVPLGVHPKGHFRPGGWGRAGTCPQRAVPSPASSGRQARRDTARHAELRMSADSPLGTAPLAKPSCDRLHVYVRTFRSLSTSVSTETPLASDHQGRRSCERGPVGPSSACLLAREACIRHGGSPLARARCVGACIPTRDVVRDDGASSLSERPFAGACEPRIPHFAFGDHSMFAVAALEFAELGRRPDGHGRLAHHGVPACPPGGRVPFRVIADTRAEPHMCLPACARRGAPFRVSACTRQQSWRVHPRPVTPTRHVTERSRPSAREACIQASLSATRTPCIQPSLSAREASIRASLFRARAKCPAWGKACIHPHVTSPARPVPSTAPPRPLASHARRLSSFRHPRPLAHPALPCPPNGGSCPPAGRRPVRTPRRESAS